MRSRPLLVVAVILLSASARLAGNWPSFRGDSASGVGTGAPPTTWDLAKGTKVPKDEIFTVSPSTSASGATAYL